MPIPKALLDANVLWSLHQRNLLLQLAVQDVIAVHWTNEILEEWLRNSPNIRGRLEEGTLPLMRRHFPHALLGEPVDTPLMGTTDSKDMHVAHAALAIAPSHLLTWNTKDFDRTALSGKSISLETPDCFLSNLFDDEPEIFIDIAKQAQANLRKSVPTWTDYLEILETRQNLKSLVFRIRSHEIGIDPDVTQVAEALAKLQGGVE